MAFDELLEEVARNHFPNPPATARELAEFEQRVGWKLDPELAAFYVRFNGASLFKRPNAPYGLLPLSRIVRARVAFFGKDRDDDAHGPASLFALCDVQDGNFVLLDVSRQDGGRYPLFDGFHETFPDPRECRQIAGSFSEFLERALRSGGLEYWLG